MMNSRLQKSLLNAKIGLVFYFLTLVLSFFSRKIFLDCLGADFIGLTGTLQNILGFLNLAEFGIGSCISYFLFKPLQEGNREKIAEAISVFGYLYHKIGVMIAAGGILISLFFPLIFQHTNMAYGIVYFSFYSFLGSSLIGYFINYRQILLTADQKNYVVSAYFQTGNIVKTLIQIYLAYYYRNLYVWVAVEFIFGLIYCLILNKKINKEYPWLITSPKSGKELLAKYPDILIKTKQIFIHKMKDFLLTKSDEIMIFAFVSLKMVAFYGNYTLIINKLAVMMSTALDGVTAGVGNLVAEGNHRNTMKVFWELMSIRYFAGGVMVFALYYLMNPFICWWLGNDYLLSDEIVILLLINLFIMQTRGVVDIFNHSHGLYGDTWAAWTEGFINLSITIAAALQWGIAGILLGKIVSMVIIVLLWKPVYLFRQGFKLSVGIYWKGAAKYYFTFLISFALSAVYIHSLPYKLGSDILSLFIYALITVIPFVILYATLLYLLAPGTKEILQRLPFIHNKRSKKKP